MWIVLAFASAIFAGMTAVLSKAGVKNIDSDVATALRTSVVLLFSWLMAWIVGALPGLSAVSAGTLLFLVGSGLATGGSWLCYFKALQLGDINKVAPVDKSSTVLTMLLSFLFLGEPMNVYKILGMVGIGVGTLLMIQKKEGEKSQNATDNRWLFFAVLSAVFASLTALLASIGIRDINSQLAVAIRTSVVLVMAWGIVLMRGKMDAIRQVDAKSARFLVFSGMATGFSWLFFYQALQEGLTSVVVPIDKLSILVSVALAYFFFGEKISPRAGIGLTLLVAGTLVLLVPA